jgi:hypothetical protein
MSARLGDIIYWLSLGVAMPSGFVSAFMFYAWFRHDFDDGLAKTVFLQNGAVASESCWSAELPVTSWLAARPN